MPDLLILSKDPAQKDSGRQFASLTEKLVSRSIELGYRVKEFALFEDALSWISSKPVDALCVSTAFSSEQVARLQTLISSHSPRAELFVFPELSKNIYQLEQGLRLEYAMLGASVIELAEIPRRLESLKSSLAGQKLERSEVLVVEDLDSPRDIICSFIEHLGVARVNGANSAEQALNQLEMEPDRFFCVVSDINMPKISGTELISSIRNHKKLRHLPVIALTAHGTPENLIKCLSAGASGFLVKPPTRQSLQRELARALRITLNGDNPRMAHEGEVEQLRVLLEKKGLL